MDVLLLLKLLGGAGAAGIVAWLFITQTVVPGVLYRAEKERADRNEARLNESIPLLERALEALDRAEHVTKLKVDEVVKLPTDNQGGGR